MRSIPCVVAVLLLCLCDATPVDRTRGSKITKRNYLELEESILDHIAFVNSEVTDMYEGDIRLTGNEDNVDLSDSGDIDGPLPTRKKRSSERDLAVLWPGRVVPYVIHSSLSGSTDAIEEAIAEFHTNSCLSFIERTDETNYINFIAEKGCWSNVGREFWKTGGQEVSLGHGCIVKGVIMHEIMHAVGFWHEQSRPDRNEFVEVLWENIKSGEEFNFNKYSHGKIDNLEVPYDMDSVMHYGTKSFSRNELPTLRSILQPERTLGQRDGFTVNDVQKLNALYDCSTTSSEGWSNWSAYGPCNTACEKTRQKFCLSTDLGQCSGANSYGVLIEQDTCPDEECYAPVEGHYGRWSAWGPCSVSCGLGTQTRERFCDDPPPANGGATCVGDSSQSQECVLVRCGLGPYDCEFEHQGFGIWSQDASDDVDWKRYSGSTPSGSTGPSADHTTGTGSYVYLESSSPAQQGNIARLLSPWFDPVEARCLQLSYHMYGDTTGTFRVKTVQYGTFVEANLLTLSGDQGNSWHTVKLDITSTTKYYVALEAVRGSSYRGDIGLDDVYFKEHSCDYAPPTDEGPTAEQLPIASLGCYNSKSPRIFPNLLQSLRSNMDWENPQPSAENIIGLCYNLAVDNNATIFGIEYYGECWGPGNQTVDYTKYGISTNCWNGIGSSNVVNVYQLI